ncbi:MAG: hemolysin secretion protein D [Robiginitomaculum sp.]|nr:MAG: hemolysin secretion protein D [Robiginitomaculum sp.]
MVSIGQYKNADAASVGVTNISREDVDGGYGKYLRNGFIALFLLVVCFGGWAALVPIKGAVIASGIIVVEGNTKTLQHLDGGIVSEILVRNGDKVLAGQVLLRLDSTAMEANATLVENRFYEAQARVDRLKAERDNLAKIIWAPQFATLQSRAKIIEILSGQSKLFSARRNAHKGQIGQLYERIAQSKEQINGLRDLMVAKRSQYALVDQELQGLQTLLAKGFVSKTRILALEREQARLNGDIGTHRSDIARTESAMSETRIQILQVKQDNEAQILTELREVESLKSDLREQLTTAMDQRRRIEIVSPVEGIVHDLVVTTIGGVIIAGQPMMQIIPANTRLMIEARIQPVDIDQIYEGQPATITLSAFNQRTVPQINGRVITASADSLVDQITGIPYFSVLIEIPEDEMKKLGTLILIPGMPADSFIQTQERTVLNYLFKPFKDQLNRTFREE